MALVAGARLGRYEVLGLIGAGGMGEVYKARDTRLGRTVALKILPPHLASDPARRERFKREARAASALEHPHICVLHDIGAEGDVDFLVLEHLEGETLAARLGKGRMPREEALHVGAQIADALDAAHKKGIIHRDLKPGNVMLAASGVKLLDFGLARLTEEPQGHEESTALRISGAGMVAGTLPYISPEQLTGAKADARSDIWALGVVLYEMLTGRRPFEGGSAATVMVAILQHDPPSLARLEPLAPPALYHVVGRCLAKDPEARWQTARDVASELGWVSEGRSAAPEPGASAWGARASSTARFTSGSTPAKRSVWRIAAVAMPVLVGAIAAALWLMGRSPALSFAPRDWVLVADFDNQTGNPLFDRSLQAAFVVGLEQSKHANVVPRTRVAAALKRMGKPDAQVIDEEVGREICIRENFRGLVRCGIGRVGGAYSISASLIDPRTGEAMRSYLERADTEADILDSLGRVSEAVRRDLGESLGAIGQANRPLPQVTTSSLEALNLFVDARQLWSRGEYKQAAAQMEAALQRDPDFAMAHAFLGSAYLSHVFTRVEDGKRHAERALALASRTTERERTYIQAAHQHDLGRLEEAAQSYALYLRSWPDDLRVRSRLADLLRQTGRQDEAIREYRELVRLAPADASAPYINMATSYTQSGRFREAIDCYEKGFALNPDAVTSGTLNHEYGFTLVKTGQREEARKVFALTLAKADTRARGLRSLGLLELYEGKYRAAAARFEEAALDNEARKSTLSAARDHLYLSIARGARRDPSSRLRELEKAASLLEGYTSPVWMVSRVGAYFARAGAVTRASQLLARIRAMADPNNMAERAFVHLLEGEIALAGGQLDEAMRTLQLADREVAENARAEVLGALARAARARNAGDANARGEAFVDSWKAMGWEPQQDWLATHYELAGAYARAGDVIRARRRLGTLLTLWKDADPDLPLLHAARQLQAQLDARPDR